MKITKELKYAFFEYDEDSKEFMILVKPFGSDQPMGNQSIKLNKVYAFAFTRFVVRMAQRNWLRSKPIKKEKELAEHPFGDPDQAEFTYEEVLLPKDYDKEDFNEKTKKQWDDLPF